MAKVVTERFEYDGRKETSYEQADRIANEFDEKGIEIIEWREIRDSFAYLKAFEVDYHG